MRFTLLILLQDEATNAVDIQDTHSPEDLIASPMTQLLMERVMATVDHSHRIQNNDGSYLDACTWPGVRCTSGGEIYKISWPKARNRAPKGCPQLEFLPPSIRKLNIHGQRIHRHLSVRDFPRESRIIDVSKNELFGRLELDALPLHLHVFDGPYNKFTGPIDLVRLPPALHVLNLYGNHIEQDEVFCDTFPPSVENIDLRFNAVYTLRCAFTGQKVDAEISDIVQIDRKRGSHK